MISFPRKFFWGAATSAHQVEGNNIHNDWWEWEKRAGLKQASGNACASYELFQEDFNLAAQLNHNAHRLSVEWSRIEPEEGKFSSQEIEHYRKVILALKERRIEPVVTLHHFTNPLWFAKQAGWLNNKASFYFCRFVERIVNALADDVRYWVTINEPLVYLYHSYILGQWPPQETSLYKAGRVNNNLAITHIKAYKIIHGLYQKKNLAECFVSIAKNTQAFVPCTGRFIDRLAVSLRDRWFNFQLIERLLRARTLDYIGINYYSRSLVEVKRWGVRNLAVDVCEQDHHPLAKNSMGWAVYPQGLYDLLTKFKRYDLPLFILENGICTDDDNQRWDYICGHLKSLHAAMEKGAKVLGYLYWSLLDNFEWDKSFTPRFGLIEVDYATLKRTVRPSAYKFAEVAKTGRL